MAALASAATLALTSPSFADDPGWYLGLGAGYDHLNNQKLVFRSGSPPFGVVKFSDNAIGMVSGGYKFDSGWRFELELAFDEHKASRFTCPTLACPFKPAKSGTTNSSALFNAAYDFDLGNYWGLTLGAGVGVGDVNEYIKDSAGSFRFASGAHNGLEWQGIAGLHYALSDDVDMFADYRYRSTEVNARYFNTSGGADFSRLHENNEHVALVGLRWYPWAYRQAPPPPQEAPPPPAAPPPPPAVKTFIVFFDFDKSNLTAEAQSVVSEAVKTAKQNGAVRVMVTGHTDTVGSDKYNQALSERRADAVKDEMVRQGMDGNEIAIAGKSFHDPLVPTGPGVREPQNRRAVIDLGAGANT
jgi:outer membrane protein OmpA-like peptidoglycan-associated protein